MESRQDPSQVTMIGSLVAPLEELSDASRAALSALDVLEVRADLTGDLEVESLRELFSGKLLYTLRSVAEWGQDRSPTAERHRRIAVAAADYDLVDLEVQRDLVAPVLATVSPDQRLLSWHGEANEDFHRILAEMDLAEAPVRKFVCMASANGQEVSILDFLLDCREAGRGDVLAFAAGECGVWTRVVAPQIGRPVLYVALGDAAAPGQISADRAMADYGFPELNAAARCFGILGQPVAHSLSPRLHNGGYRASGVEAIYLPFHAERFADFWMDTLESGIFDRLGIPLAGMSVTTPYKESALAIAGASSPRAARLRAGNTLLQREGVWECVSTDPEGVIVPLLRRGVELEGAQVAVVGCGGAGRAAALGLREQGAVVTLVNRTVEPGQIAAERLGVHFLPLTELDPSLYRVMVQATALGGAADDPLPWDPAAMASDAVLVEMVYRSGATEIERRAQERSLQTVGGREVLLFQGLEQFRLMSGEEMDVELGQRLLGLEEGN